MHMVTVTMAMLLVFQVKHYVADYLLQPGWVIAGKGDFRRPGRADDHRGWRRGGDCPGA